MRQTTFAFHSEKLEWTAHIDGGSRGNPGEAGFGVVIADSAKNPQVEIHGYLGHQTNNYAEYKALLAALDYALSQGCRHLHVYSDSELLVKQLEGSYRIKSPALRPLYDEALSKIARLKRFKITHVRRHENKRADELANLAIDSKNPFCVEAISQP